MNDEFPVPVLLVSKKDGSVLRRFPSVYEAGKAVGKSPAAVHKSARDLGMAKGEAMFRFESSWAGRETFKPRARNRPVIVAWRGMMKWFPGAHQAAEAVGVSYDSMRGMLSRGGGSRNGMRARYATGTDDWPRLRERYAARKEE